MYQNLNHRPSAANSPKPFSVRLDPIPVNEKAVYVHSVCAALIDSRFGPGRSTPFVHDLRESPERGATVFCDLTIDGPVPSYSILPDAEMARRYMAHAIRRELAQADAVAVSIHVQPLPRQTWDAGHRKFPRDARFPAPDVIRVKTGINSFRNSLIFDNLRHVGSGLI